MSRTGDGVGQRADRQVVHAGRGVRAAATARVSPPVASSSARPADGQATASRSCSGVMLSQQDRSAPASTASRAWATVSTSTSTGTSGNAGADRLERRGDAAGGELVVVLDHRDVGQGHPLVGAAAAAHRVLLQRAQARRGLAGVADPRRRCPPPRRPSAGCGSRRRTGGRAGSARCARRSAGPGSGPARSAARRPARRGCRRPTGSSNSTGRLADAPRRPRPATAQPGDHAVGPGDEVGRGRPGRPGSWPGGHVDAAGRGPRPARADHRRRRVDLGRRRGRRRSAPPSWSARRSCRSPAAVGTCSRQSCAVRRAGEPGGRASARRRGPG